MPEPAKRVRVTVNGVEHVLREGATVRALVEQLNIHGPVAVERNREIVPRARHPEVALEDGDVIEVVRFVGGG